MNGLGTRLWWMDEWCNIFQIRIFNVSSSCTLRLSSLDCLTSVRSNCLPSCSLWRRHCSLAVALSSHARHPEAICLSQSVDSSALSYTVRSPLSQRTLKSFSMCAKLKCMCTFVPFVQFKYSVYGLTYVHRQTDMRMRFTISHASMGLAQARPNYG